MNPQLIDNLNNRFADHLKEQLKPGSRVSIVAACFSIFAFHELQQQLEQVEEMRFIFNSPAFTTDNLLQEEPVFRLERQQREGSLHGIAFELQLRNGLTQKAIARECVEWIRKKVRFFSNTTRKSMMGFAQVDEVSYAPLTGFTTADLGVTRGNAAYTMMTKHQAPNSLRFMKLFDELWHNKSMMEDVTEEVIRRISIAYQENAPEFIYFVALYNIFSAFLEDLNEDHLPNDMVGFKDSRIWQMLYNFQRDAALALINKLEKYNGCILADSVGLGKTFTALAVIKYYEMRNKSVLVLCPKKLQNNWNTFKDNYLNNPVAEDRLNYDVLFHTDLSRDGGMSNGLDLDRLNWGNYDLLVIDESHNFRNGGQQVNEDGRENRYQRLMNQVIRKGVKTRVLMLSATPVNNRFVDLRNQLALAYEGEATYWTQYNDGANFKAYVETMRKWYAEGLIDEEFVSQKYDAWAAKITGDKVGMFFCFPDNVGSYEASIQQTLTDKGYGDPEKVMIYGMVPVKGIDGKPYTYDNDNAMVTYTGASQPTVITTAAVENGKIYKCLELLNYLYSEEGSELINWGVEGVSYTKDADGNNVWTDKITNDPDYGMADAVFKYALPTMGGWPKAMSYEAWGSMNLVVPNQIITHKNYAQADPGLDLPGFALNSEEQEAYNNVITEVNTAVSEVYLSVITGKRPVEDIDKLLSQVKAMGVDDAVAAYQSAYSRFLAR